MKRFIAAWWLLSLTAYAEWFPPENPKPSVILGEAKADVKAGRYDDALAKHLWFFQNAIAFEKSLYGVRLSFALVDWWNLAAEYPPAMEAMRNMRDAAEEGVLSAKPAEPITPETYTDQFQQFHDFVALNERLRETDRTAELFKWLDEHQPEKAAQVFAVAEGSLIEVKNYALCGKYLKPERDFAQLSMMLALHRKMAKEGRAGMKEFGEQSFSAGAATLVSLLVLNNRVDEARSFRDRAAELWDARLFRDRLDEALGGKLPPPYPPRD